MSISVLEASVASAIAAAGLSDERFYLLTDSPHSNIFVTRPNAHKFYWAVPAGSDSYPPEQKPFGHVLEIKAGSGLITHNKVTMPYKKGDVIQIRPGDTYGLARRDEATVVLRGPSDVPSFPRC